MVIFLILEKKFANMRFAEFKLGTKSPIFILALFLQFSFFNKIFAEMEPKESFFEESEASDSLKSSLYYKNKDSFNTTISNGEILNIWEKLKANKSFQKRQWEKLLHFERDIILRKRSQVTDSRFFISSLGYKNPEDEMKETLISFFWKTDKLNVLYDDFKTENPQHPICKFPARLKFIKNEMRQNEIFRKLPVPDCYYRDLFLRSLKPQSISFVFSSYYANSPGSAFGHTFFRVNKKEKEGRKKQELLDYGISFAANAQTENPLMYAILGLAGGFNGTYTNVPYYYKVREYNDFESRDLWSYELNLTEDELETLVFHFWEIGPHFFTYYFFSQNCSYQMLTALEAAAPRLSFSEKLPVFIIPADSVKVLFTEKDFVKNVEFRPSMLKQFDSRFSLLDKIEKKVFISYVKNQKLPSEYDHLTEERKSMVIDTVLNYADLKDPLGIAKREGPWFAFKETNLLTRARLDFISEELKIPTPELERPESSHPSSRVALGAGEEKRSQSKKVFFEFRFALHDLLDSKRGLPKFSQLEFGNFKFSTVVNSIFLDHFSFFKVQQLNPLTDLEKKLSWSMEVGTKRFDFCDSRIDCFGHGFKSMFGYAVDLNSFTMWLMPSLEYRYGEYFEKERNHFALGGQGGLIYSLSDKHRFYLFYEKQWFNASHHVEENHWEYRFNYQKNISFSMISSSQNYQGLFYLYF